MGISQKFLLRCLTELMIASGKCIAISSSNITNNVIVPNTYQELYRTYLENTDTVVRKYTAPKQEKKLNAKYLHNSWSNFK